MRELQGKRRILNVIITLGIILMLIFSGPSSAVTVRLSMDGLDNKEVGQPGFFYFNVTIGGDERIPIANFTITGLPDISGSSGGTLLFNLSDIGTTEGNTTTKGNYVIELFAIYGWTSGSTGYGYGYSSNEQTAPYEGTGYGYDFTGEGYGYGTWNPSADQYTKLSYKITVNTTGVTPGTYNVAGNVNTGQPSVLPAFTSSVTSFTLAQPSVSIPGSVSGTVTDSSGVGISGASVYAMNATEATIAAETTTAGDGTYMIQSITPGTYTLNTTATNYAWNNSTIVVVSSGTLNSSRNIILAADRVALALKSGETASKTAVKGNATMFNLTATNYGTNATFNVTNSTTTATVNVSGVTSNGDILLSLLNGSESKTFNVTVVRATPGYYPITMTVVNATTSKSASVTLYATMRNETGNTIMGGCIIDTTSGANAIGGAVLNNASVLSGAVVNASTIVNTTVSGNATVKGGSTVVYGNVTGNANVTSGSTVRYSNVTGINSIVKNGAIVDSSTVTNSTVDSSKIVNVTATDSTITGVSINTSYSMAFTGVTVTAAGDGRPQVTGGTVVTRNVNFTNVYTSVLIDDLVIQQTGDADILANRETSINESDTVGCDLTVNMTAGASVNITKTTISPDGEGSDVTRSTVLSKFLHVQCNNTTAVQSLTIRIYCDASVSAYATVKMYYYNTAQKKWVGLDTTSGNTSDGRRYYEATPNHLTTFTVMGVTSDSGGGGGSSTWPSGGGGGGFALPTATAKATVNVTPAATAVKTAKPAPTKKPVVEKTPAAEGEMTPAKPKKKGLLPGFEGVFAIAGLLAIAYLMLRKRR